MSKHDELEQMATYVTGGPTQIFCDSFCSMSFEETLRELTAHDYDWTVTQRFVSDLLRRLCEEPEGGHVPFWSAYEEEQHKYEQEHQENPTNKLMYDFACKYNRP